MNMENEGLITARRYLPRPPPARGGGQVLVFARQIEEMGHGKYSLEDQDNASKQITYAEERKKIRYLVSYPVCYYEIKYGLLKEGGKGRVKVSI